jgi:cytochrome c556
MNKTFAISVVLLLGLSLVAGLRTDDSLRADQKQEAARVLTIKQMMSGLVKPHKAALETALKEPPSGAESWDALIVSAALLNESGYILVDGERSLDKVWSDASQTLRNESAHLLAALKQHDYEASAAAFKQLTTACAACHKAHLNK